ATNHGSPSRITTRTWPPVSGKVNGAISVTVVPAFVVVALAWVSGAVPVASVKALVARVGAALVALQVLALVGVGPHQSPPGWSTSSPSRISPVSGSTSSGAV